MMCKHIFFFFFFFFYSASVQCSITGGYLEKTLVTSQGCPYPSCYNCPRRAFQTLPRSPLSSLLQLLTSHPGKINSLTMHNMERPGRLADIDGHIQTLVQSMRSQTIASWQTHLPLNCWANQWVLLLAQVRMEAQPWVSVFVFKVQKLPLS